MINGGSCGDVIFQPINTRICMILLIIRASEAVLSIFGIFPRLGANWGTSGPPSLIFRTPWWQKIQIKYKKLRGPRH